ncbi:unnamed protein product, partial [Gulo gulo]
SFKLWTHVKNLKSRVRRWGPKGNRNKREACDPGEEPPADFLQTAAGYAWDKANPKRKRQAVSSLGPRERRAG